MLRIGLKRNKKLNKKSSKKIRIKSDEDVLNTETIAPLGDNPSDDVEKRLETAVFGQHDDILEHLQNSHRPAKTVESEDDDEVQRELVDNNDQKPIVAWQDEDDDDIDMSKVERSLQKPIRGLTDSDKRQKYVQKKFTQLMGVQPEWAKLKHERVKTEHKTSQDEESSADELTTTDVICKSSRLLKNVLDFKKCSDLNKSHRDISIIKHVEFHPSSQVAAIAGVSGNVSLFQVDGHMNPKIQSVCFDKFPVEKAHFTKDGNEIVVVSASQPYFFYYDMIRGHINRVALDKSLDQRSILNFEMSPDGRFMIVFGKYGYIYILTAKTKELIGSVKMNGYVKSVAFTSSASHMYSYGSDGEVYIWDTRNWGDCYHRFYDDGSTGGTALCLSPNQQYLACGSKSGVVNIYDTNNLINSKTPKPLKAILNLTTSVTDLKFNATSELLCMASSFKDNSAKLVHFPSMTVFSNFPRFQENLRRPVCVDFSLNSGYLTISNNTGRALLYRLNHYGNY